jgi:hypothetical protein
VYAETAVHARAREAHENAELGGSLVQHDQYMELVVVCVGRGRTVAYPLRTRRIAVDALVVVVCLLYLQQLYAQPVSFY